MEDIIFNLEYEDNVIRKTKLLTIFENNNIKYAALEQLDADKNIELVRIEEVLDINKEIVDYEISNIETKEEFEIAKKQFEMLLSPEPIKIKLTNENNEEMEYIIIDTFSHNNINYCALSLNDVTEKDIDEDGNVKFQLMRINYTTKNGVEGCIVNSILNDVEYAEISEVFKKRFTK